MKLWSVKTLHNLTLASVRVTKIKKEADKKENPIIHSDNTEQMKYKSNK